jgi:hypothetical protein
MASRNSIEDLESGALEVKPVVDTNFNADVEFERIEENYRTTMIAGELPGAFIISTPKRTNLLTRGASKLSRVAGRIL